MTDFLLNNIYGHSVIVITVLLGLTVLTLFNQEHVMYYGTMILMLWLVVEVYFIVNAKPFWPYIGNFIVAGIASYAILFGLFFLCEKFGKHYRGDGGLIALMPVTMFPVFIGLAILIKGIIVFWNYLFN